MKDQTPLLQIRHSKNILNYAIVEYLPVLLAMCFSRSIAKRILWITSPFLHLGDPVGHCVLSSRGSRSRAKPEGVVLLHPIRKGDSEYFFQQC